MKMSSVLVVTLHQWMHHRKKMIYEKSSSVELTLPIDDVMILDDSGVVFIADYNEITLENVK